MKTLTIETLEETKTTGTFKLTEKQLLNMHTGLMKVMECLYEEKELFLNPKEFAILSSMVQDIEKSGLILDNK
ncbi:hypothetical protein EBB07_28220 [Paenibacillaceae bacterium]|nr:hypothetical protein EBB07_28220 [Paenibacillaceae bacterium]